ncbi:MAG TPA: beta-N-acetylhexosaminidase [Thermoleophilia bacterium]|nr:beta-N-acetylhexosaminidase [Thermoleophilia bacterium]
MGGSDGQARYARAAVTDPDAVDRGTGLGLVPRPVEIKRSDGWFKLTADAVLDADAGSAGVAALLRGWLTPATGFPLHDASTPADEARPVISLSCDAADLGAEEYRLVAAPGRVSIESGSDAGVFYGAQTLRALLGPRAYRSARVGDEAWRIPALTIADRPRFGWRGALLDVARHFLPVRDVLRFIDQIALHKLNILHLHLTDDQGWRVQIKRYPRLTEVGAWRRESQIGDRRHDRFDGRPHGGYYTQDDIREIVAYAAERHITVVPEIDVPGHTGAAIAAYPELGNTDVPGRPADLEVVTRWGIHEDVLNAEESTLRFVFEVFDEVLALFPSRYIGVGGDECPPVQWEDSARARARIAELGLSSADAIRGWYTAQLGEYLAARGRTLFGWDEICDAGIQPPARDSASGTVIGAWRSVDHGIAAARAGYRVVMCPEDQVYLDWRQADGPDEPIPVGKVTDLARVHAFEPVPRDLLGTPEAGLILGAQCNIWTEHLDAARAVDYAAFPRLSAFSETVWGGADRDFEDLRARLAVHERRLDALGIEYRRDAGPLPWQSRPDALGWPR